jgi:linoleoyl-CoA desaturase
MSRLQPLAPDQGLRRTLDREVGRQLSALALSRRGGAAMRRKAALMFGLWAGSYLALLLGRPSRPGAIPLLALLALSVVGLGVNVQHDANHNAFSNRRWVNRLLGFTLDLMGGSSYFWRFKHNLFHHGFANIVGLDEDVTKSPFLRLAPADRWRWFHVAQPFYAWLLYSLNVLRWQLWGDFRTWIRGRVGRHRVPRPRRGELAGLVLGKVLFAGWSLILPCWLLPVGPVLLAFLGTGALVGLLLSTIFQLSHCNAEAHDRTGTGATWSARQVYATVNFCRRSRLVSWCFGALNLQIEHHLLPNVCHANYVHLTDTVERICREHALPYRCYETLPQALAAHARWLSVMSKRSTQTTDAPP